ncbi:MAG TPA: DNA topoisomerase III, partial [Ruminococcus sp.]|nr:DNA topoisomerase III [Ruminococcus sp.]
MILIVAEKPSVGRVIASVVGAEERHEGYIQGSGYIVSWCLGHLVTLQAPNDYNNGWQDKWNFSQLPMIP